MWHNDSSRITSLHLHKRIYSTQRPQFSIIIKFESSLPAKGEANAKNALNKMM